MKSITFIMYLWGNIHHGTWNYFSKTSLPLIWTALCRLIFYALHMETLLNIKATCCENGFQKTSHGNFVFTLGMFGSIKANSSVVALLEWFLWMHGLCHLNLGAHQQVDREQPFQRGLSPLPINSGGVWLTHELSTTQRQLNKPKTGCDITRHNPIKDRIPKHTWLFSS